MRLPLLAAALVTGAVHVPAAEAASSAACVTALVHPAVGTSAECTTYLPQFGYRASRYFVVHGVSGTVDATLTCGGIVAASRRVAAGTTQTLVVTRSTSTICTGRLVAVTSGAQAAGLNTMVVDVIDER